MTAQAASVDGPAERVRTERRLRGWSIRTAANKGGISNQTWSVFERTGTITDGIQRAVMQAFDWPARWAENPPPLPQGVAPRSQYEGVDQRVTALARKVDQMQSHLERLDGELRQLRAAAAKRPSRGIR